ncbi:hypothetical protein KI387_025610, partial [Taxus chinensis]
MAKNSLDGVLKAGSDAVVQRRILFHPARNKTENGCGSSAGFYLEPLNPQLDCSPTSGFEKPSAPEPAKPKPKEDAMDSEFTGDIGFRRIGAGLANLGNTCFLNSVLQCLTYTQPLAAYFQSGRHKLTCRVAGFCAMCAVQDHAITASGSSGKILSPTFLVRNLRCISRSFRISRQEDAHEYMMNLMEAMHKCCLPAGVTSESPVAYEKSLVHKIFGGRLISQVRCTQCSHCSDKFDPFLDLSLEIVRADSLLKALLHYTAVEQLDGGMRRYQCEQCKVKVKALKQLKIDKAPYALAIHLKRFSAGGSGGKIDKKVDFGCTLNLKPFVSSSLEDDLKYTLYGVLVHDGWSTHSGHYYCFIRSSTGIWHALDDNRVYPVSEKSVLSQKAYILFYIRDKKTTITKGGSQLQDSVSKVKLTVPLNIGSTKENQLQDSCAPQGTSNLLPISSVVAGVNMKSKLIKQVGKFSNGHFIAESVENRTSAAQSSHDAMSQLASTNGILTNDIFTNHVITNGCMTNNSCNGIRQQGSEVNGTDAVDKYNEIQDVRHLRKSAVSNGNECFSGRNPGIDSKNNDSKHQDAKNSGNDLAGIISGHHSTNSRKDSNGKYAASRPLENGHAIGNSMDTECRDATNSSLEDDSSFQEGENGALLCMGRGMNGSHLKTIHTDRLSKHIKEPKCASKEKHQKNLEDSRYLLCRKRLKLTKHLGCARFLKTSSFSRHFLLRAMYILRKKRSYERKKHTKLQLKKAGVFLRRKSSANLVARKKYAGTENSGCSIASKLAQQSCAKDLSNGNSVQYDKMSEITNGVAQNGCNIAKFGDTSLALGNGQLANGNHNKLKKLREVVAEGGLSKARCKNSDVEPTSKINKSLISAHPRNAIDEFPAGSELSKDKTWFPLHQSNSGSKNGGESCQQERAPAVENCESSSLETKLRGAAVPCWDGVDDDWVKRNRAWDKQTNRVGHVLDEWDEEYDRGRRKKVKQRHLDDGIDDSYGRYSNGHSNPFQSLANRKAKIP